MKVKFKDWLCDVVKGSYSNGRTALILTDADDGLKICTATINIPSAQLSDKEIIIKDYSENEGIYIALASAGIVGEIKRYIQSGFTNNAVCDCLI